MEGREWMLDNGTWTVREYENARKIINQSAKRNLNENILKIFKNYFKNI
jgi:hypothetical protein